MPTTTSTTTRPGAGMYGRWAAKAYLDYEDVRQVFSLAAGREVSIHTARSYGEWSWVGRYADNPMPGLPKERPVRGQIPKFVPDEGQDMLGLLKDLSEWWSNRPARGQRKRGGRTPAPGSGGGRRQPRQDAAVPAPRSGIPPVAFRSPEATQ
jgi:hypothetical protein